jgi:hypothetical protein
MPASAWRCTSRVSGKLEDNRVRFVTPGIVALGGGEWAAMARDPDGHVLLLEDSDNGR